MDKHTQIKVSYFGVTENMQDKARGHMCRARSVDDDSTADLLAEHRGIAQGLFDAWVLIFAGEYRSEDYDRWCDILS